MGHLYFASRLQITQLFISNGAISNFKEQLIQTFNHNLTSLLVVICQGVHKIQITNKQ